MRIGDYVYLEKCHKNGTIINDRGGYVGRWLVKTDDGELLHDSTRDLTVIKSARPTPQTRLSANDKIDLLLEYLGLDIEDEPRVIKRQNDEEASS